MAENLTSQIVDRILDHVHGVAPLTIALPLRLALYTDIPDDDNPGVEVSGGGYARQEITMGAAGNGLASNTNEVGPYDMPATVVYGFKIVDAAGLLIWQGPLAVERPFAAGDTTSFPVGSLVVRLT